MQRDDATTAQVRAADPSANTWLSANAGSGKTRVLTDRVARLLLLGTAPQNILCLTYTKAAASEMQNRLFKRLGAWAMMPDAELRQSLAELSDDAPGDATTLAQARRLFAAAIETPGGLKIQTIHSFCSSILRRFPMEAGVNPNFHEMEDTAARHLREDILEAMSDGPQSNVVDALALHFTGAEVDQILSAMVRHKDKFGQQVTLAETEQVLGIGKTVTEDQIVARCFAPGDRQLIGEAISMLQASGTNDAKAAEKLAAIDLTSPLTLDALPILESALLTGVKANNPFTAKIGSLPIKKTRDENPELTARLEDLMQRVEDARQLRLARKALVRSEAMLDFGKVFVAAYEQQKQERGLLDFDDLILRTRDLLTNGAVAQWVLFRLDGGVDHILVDEAQDTSPAQWQVIDLLTQEFRAGLGASTERDRTIFVVGDKKQSIYSFQGADPAGFDRMRDQFGKALGDLGKTLQREELLYSFRSSAAILNLVDAVFTGDMAEGLEDKLTHLSFHSDMPGRVDLWPSIPKQKDEPGDWRDPVDQIGALHHSTQLARKIAKQIKHMIAHETLPDVKDERRVRRPITPGDFLILVKGRTRSAGLFRQIIAACKREGLDVAGADRVKLDQELAVRDIISLLNFLALAEDDLSLAEALKSPLFNWSEKQLYDLAQPRPDGQSLWEALRAAKDRHPETLMILDDLRAQSDFLRPYDLINRILIRHDGRRRFIARMGEEIEDGIDALLSEALSYEQDSVPSLTGFLAWFGAETVEIKRQISSSEDKIRIMTVHGAKGLEAPIVILPDTTPPGQGSVEQILGQDSPIWRPASADMPRSLEPQITQERTKDAEEFRRLLYVALTRAEKWLIVANAGNPGNDRGSSWYKMVEAGMEHLGSVPLDDAAGAGQRYEFGNWGAGEIVAPASSPPTRSVAPGFGPDLPELVERTKTLSPSDLGGAKALPGEGETEEDISLARGRVVHHLLEHLPKFREPERAERARQMLAALPDAFLLDDAEDLATEIAALLSDPGLSHIFDTGLAEVSVTASLDALGGRRIHGAIDRLIVTGDEVLAIDFKSNRLVPASPEQVPDGLLRQMAAYRDALALIYPGRIVKTAILWTTTRHLMEIPDALLTPALTRVSFA